MSRRSGQDGHIEVSGKWFVVRFWKDVTGQEKRVHASERICPVTKPGLLTKSERERRAKEIITASGADTPECLARAEGVAAGVTFREQATWWIEHVQQRRRKPIAPATVDSWQRCLRVWLNPNLGDVPLVSVANRALKGLVEKMVKAGLSPKTINTYSQVVKTVVASAVNDEGEQLYPRTWNHEFCDIPEVDESKQNTPCFSGGAITGIITSSKGPQQMLYALLAGAGFRVGEAIGIEVQKHISDDFRTLHIRQKVRRGKLEPFLKTKAGCRDVDLCPALAGMLKNYVGERTSGFLLTNQAGGLLSQTDLLRRSLHPILKALGQGKAGFNAFRRYRMTWLRKNRVHLDLENFWMGHANRTVGDGYSKLKDDRVFCLQEAEKVGLGFELPPQPVNVVPNVPKIRTARAKKTAA